MLRLGKTEARPDAVSFKLADYLVSMPKPPAYFGHEAMVKNWGMLGNDSVGDCVLAGGAHETEVWCAEGGKLVSFSPRSVISDYSAITGYDPSDPSSDKGTDLQVAASYRRKTGLLDANGKRHRVGAYLALTPGNWAQHLQALYLFGAVGIGIRFPRSAMDQFNAGKYWSLNKTSPIEGGHYVPLVAKRGAHLVCVTWGKLQPMTQAFFQYFNDESLVYVSAEMLNGQGKSPEGLNLVQLSADLNALGGIR